MFKSKVLVTGGAGYIGSVICDKLLRKNYDVIVLERKGFNNIGLHHYLTNPKLKIIKADIRDFKSYSQYLKHVNYVINLAAVSDGRAGAKNPEITYEVNHIALNNFLKTCLNSGIQRFIQASTISVYGNKYKQPLTEDLALYPEDAYSISKAKSEEMIRNANTHDFTTSIIRSSLVCGWSPKMRFDFIVNTLTYNAIAKNKITILGGKQIRPQIHIDDISDCFIKFLDAPTSLIAGEIFNSSSQNPSILEIAETIKLVLGKDIKIEILPYRDKEDSFIVNSDKIFKTLNISPNKSIFNAIEDICEAFQKGLWKVSD